MIAIVAILNAVLTFAFGLVCRPLQWIGPFGSLFIVSFLGGLLLVWIFGKVSNQDAIRRTRDRLSGELIGLRLFKDDLKVFFAIQLQVLLWTFRYLRHSLLPMLILMVPTILILIQLNHHYGFRPLRVGEQAVVKVKVRDAATLAQGTRLTLVTPANLKIETDGVRIPELREICWRVRAVSPGRFDLTVSDGRESVAKQAAVGDKFGSISSVRTGEDWFTTLLYPGESPISSQSAFAAIEIRYPELEISFLGKSVHWLILFLVVSIGFGYACKGMLGVQI